MSIKQKQGGKAGRSDSPISEKVSLMGPEDGPKPTGWKWKQLSGERVIEIRASPAMGQEMRLAQFPYKYNVGF